MSITFCPAYSFRLTGDRSEARDVLTNVPYTIPGLSREDLAAQGMPAQRAEMLLLYYRSMVRRMEKAYPFDPHRRKLQALVRRHQAGTRGEAQRQAIREAIEQILANHPAGEPISLNTDLGLPITLAAFNSLLGLELKARDIALALEVGSLAMINGSDPAKLLEGWLSYRPVVSAIEKALASGQYDRGGLLASLAEFAAQNNRPRDMVIMSSAVLIVAGSSVHRSLAPLLRIILANPEIAAALARDESNRSLEELLRLHPPLPKISRFDAEASQKPDKSFILVDLEKANTCSQTFARPEEFCPSRDNHGSMTFGYGPYACDGAPISRTFMHEAIRALLNKTRGLRMVQDGDDQSPFLIYDKAE